MGAFTRPVTFAALDGSASIDAEAVIDTGSTFALIPQDWAEQLRLPVLDEEDVELADGTVQRMRVAAVWLEMQGRTRVANVYLAPPGATPLIGASCLGVFGFGVDPEGQRLIPQVLRLLTLTNWPTW